MLKNEILELKKKGSTIIFSTHDMGSVEELCDYITLINKSKTILEGDVHNIRMEYKSNTYEIGFNGNAEVVNNQLNGRCQVVSQVEERDHIRIKIKADRSLSGNDMLSLILPVASVTSFNEVIPTMNEIFINVVEAQNQQKPKVL
jgi:ABC-2 type transport system ATP-binding protein